MNKSITFIDFMTMMLPHCDIETSILLSFLLVINDQGHLWVCGRRQSRMMEMVWSTALIQCLTNRALCCSRRDTTRISSIMLHPVGCLFNCLFRVHVSLSDHKKLIRIWLSGFQIFQSFKFLQFYQGSSSYTIAGFSIGLSAVSNIWSSILVSIWSHRR